MTRPSAKLAIHVSPDDGCGCAACEAARLDHWQRLSETQRRAIELLHPTSPRHVDDIVRQHVALRTIASLLTGNRTRPAPIQQLDLRRPLLSSPYYSFLLLSRHGAEMLATARRAARS